MEQTSVLFEADRCLSSLGVEQCADSFMSGIAQPVVAADLFLAASHLCDCKYCTLRVMTLMIRIANDAKPDAKLHKMFNIRL